MILSPSYVMMYRNCPHKYQLITQEGFTEPSNIKKDLGRLVHSVCQTNNLDIIKDQEPHIQYLARIMHRQFKAMFGDRKILETEKEIEFELGNGLRIIVHMDIIFNVQVIPGCIEIKTSIEGVDPKNLVNNIQFPSYAKAMEIAYGKKCEINCFALGGRPGVYDYKFTKDRWVKCADEYMETADLIQARQFEKKPSWMCSFCGFNGSELCQQ